MLKFHRFLSKFSKFSNFSLHDTRRWPVRRTPASSYCSFSESPAVHDLSSMRKILNVAEKNDAAKNIAAIMSRGTARRRDGLSVYNKIYEYDYNVQGQQCRMVMTSVSGHLLNREFPAVYRSWEGCNPLVLFEAPVIKTCSPDYMPIKNTLEREVMSCDTLIIWTDCDREGENIGFEVLEVCRARKPNLRIFRAKFSQITAVAINQAMARLIQPDQRVSDAVDVRSELDLRIGAAFTRFQTLRLQKLFPVKLGRDLISYGSCQFPTLGFVTERYKSILDFITEPFWKIEVSHTVDEVTAEFRWQQGHLFDELAVLVLFERCEENPTATVENVQGRPKSKWRPLPMDTVELEKLGSRKLRLTAAETMRTAETLYTNGLISYPRTETNIFPKDLALRPLVEMQVQNPTWGGNQQKVYELIVRHFLACCSKDAKGHETKVLIDIAGEKFQAHGLIILERNYLEVYVYERWSDSELPLYQVGQRFQPSRLEMTAGETSPPKLLTEADLISLMEKHGIGTDATHAEHIETIKKRNYVTLHENRYFMPCHLGMGLVEGYDSMGFNMSKPYLRAELEADLKRICEGAKQPQDVLNEQIRKYRTVFQSAVQQAVKLDDMMERHMQEQRAANVDVALPAAPLLQKVRPCPSCGEAMLLKQKRPPAEGYFLTCSGFPGCRASQWFPAGVREVTVTDQACPQCGPETKLLHFRFQRGELDVFYPELQHTTCVACDQQFLENLGIRQPQQQPDGRGVAAGWAGPGNGRGGGGGDAQPRGRGQQPGGGDGGAPPFPWGGGGGGGVARGRGQPPGGGGYRGGGDPPNPWDGGGGGVARGRGQPRGRGGRGGGVARGRDAWQRPAPPPPPQQGPGGDGDQGGGEVNCNCAEPAVLRTVRKEGANKGRQFHTCSKGPGQQCGFFLWADEQAAPAARGAAPQQQPRGGRGADRAAMPPPPPRAPAWGLGDYQPPQPRANPQGAGGGGVDAAQDGEVFCNCAIKAVLCTVRKESANKGRQFYGCSKGMGNGCRFFQWADEGGAAAPAAAAAPAPPQNTWGGDGFQQQPARGGGGGWGGGGYQQQPARGGGGGWGGAGGRGRPRGQGVKRKCSNCGQEGHTRPKCPAGWGD